MGASQAGVSPGNAETTPQPGTGRSKTDAPLDPGDGNGNGNRYADMGADTGGDPISAIEPSGHAWWGSHNERMVFGEAASER